jgi:flagellar basal body rod protein FlgC
MAFYQLEPFGEERDDLRSGIVASTIANANRNPKKRRRPFRPKEFMPVTQKTQRREQTWQDQLRIVEMWNAALGGKDLRHGDKGVGS